MSYHKQQSPSRCTSVTATTPKCTGHSWCLAGNDGTEENKQRLQAPWLPRPSRSQLNRACWRKEEYPNWGWKKVPYRQARSETFALKQLREGFHWCTVGVRGKMFVPWQSVVLTVCVYSNDEVISHGLGLSQLIGVAIMDHVIAGRKNKIRRTFPKVTLS